MPNNILGTIEEVSLPALGVSDVLAKVDTGAYSGALHCTDIKVVRRGPERVRTLVFLPLGKKKKKIETTEFMETFIRSATGHRVKRYVVDADIAVRGSHYPIRIGLSDRGKMKFPVLLGRRFLRENGMTVDVRVNAEYDDEGENTR